MDLRCFKEELVLYWIFNKRKLTPSFDQFRVFFLERLDFAVEYLLTLVSLEHVLLKFWHDTSVIWSKLGIILLHEL